MDMGEMIALGEEVQVMGAPVVPANHDIDCADRCQDLRATNNAIFLQWTARLPVTNSMPGTC